MKKVESVLNGSTGCGKTRSFATFAHIHNDLLSLILPKIFTIQEEGGRRKRLPSRVEALPKRLIRSYLTIQNQK